LLQALTRVNRPYKDFKYGYVVDFVDIKENFDATNDRYLRELNKTTEDTGLELSADPGQVIIENPEEVKQQIKELTDFLWNFPTENYEEFREVIDGIEDKEPLYHLRKILEDAKGLGNRIRSSGNVELQDKYKNMLPGGIPVCCVKWNAALRPLTSRKATTIAKMCRA
jgi:Type I site-specific restriction-modification system, R (restriction) subunit and related helicases